MAAVTEARRGQRPSLPELPPLFSAVSFRPALKRLYRQRKETAALRDLFYSRGRRRSGKRVEPRGRQLDPARKTPDTATPPGPDHSHHHVAAKPLHSFPSLARAPAAVEHSSKESAERDILPALTPSRNVKTVRHLPEPNAETTPQVKNRRKQAPTSNQLRHGDVRQQEAARGRRKTMGACSASFRALTQLCSRPLPQLLEGPVRSLTLQPGFTRDLQAWQNEIVKVVPTRPGFVLPLTPGDGSRQQRQSTRYPYKVQSLHPASHFYRSWSKITHKDYVIHPEWSSEKGLKITQ